ncbi:MAG: hypothetical protein AAGA16_22730 [Cyanobacteria bacterium P01_E01_bin.35]
MSIIIAVQTDEMKEIAEKAAEKEAIENKAEAKATASNLKENYPDWKDKLPDCPCTQEEIDKSNLFDRNDNFLETYHPGAASGYRSSEPVEIKSPVNPKLPELEAGQQCMYNKEGNLITHGKAAGTPDAYSPSISDPINSFNHYQTDVFPSQNMSTKEYHKEWTPNNGNNCPENWGNKETKPEPEKDTNSSSENQNPEIKSDKESDHIVKSSEGDRNSSESSVENPQLEEINSEANTETDTNTEQEIESFDDEPSIEDSESFLESDSKEIESFAEISSESFESFSDSSAESFGSFAESSAEMTGESSGELVAEMG